MEQRRTPVWLWMNLLSLDAPLVAVVWQDFLARCFATDLGPAGRWGLGLTVWAIYLADRLVDVSGPPQIRETPPHRFYRRNTKMAEGLLGLTLFADLLIATLWLRQAVIANGLVVSAGVVTYFGVFPMQRIAAPWKPLSAAILFSAGVFLVTWTGMPHPEATLFAPMAVFCALCLANLLLIGRWERGEESLGAGWWLLLFAVGCAYFGASKWYAAVALGAAGLALLALFGDRMPRAARRVLADAVLLSPVVFL